MLIKLSNVWKQKPSEFKDCEELVCAAIKQIFCHKRVNSKIRGISEFSLTEGQFLYLSSQNCDYCGEAPSNLFRYRASKSRKLLAEIEYSGIDRIDSDKGYFFENCISCCWKCNRIKSDADSFMFLNQVMNIDENFPSLDNVTNKINKWQENIATFLEKR